MTINHSLFSLLEAYKYSLQNTFSQQLPQFSLLYFRVLRLLGAGYGTTPQQVALKLRRDKAQVTRLLAEMESVGLLQKLPHPQDKRSVLLQLTAAGVTLLTKATELEQQLVDKMTAGISPEQLQQLQAGLQLMRENLEA